MSSRYSLHTMETKTQWQFSHFKAQWRQICFIQIPLRASNSLQSRIISITQLGKVCIWVQLKWLINLNSLIKKNHKLWIYKKVGGKIWACFREMRFGLTTKIKRYHLQGKRDKEGKLMAAPLNQSWMLINHQDHNLETNKIWLMTTHHRIILAITYREKILRTKHIRKSMRKDRTQDPDLLNSIREGL